MKNNIVIMGTSRSDGNTKSAIDLVFQNIEHTFIDLNDHDISYYDYNHENQSDDFLPIIENLCEYQNIFLCSPIYWYSVSATMKVFIDRFSDLITIRKDLGRKLAGKNCYLISTGTNDTLPRCFEEPIKLTCDYLDMNFINHLYYYSGSNKALLEKNPEKLELFLRSIK